MGHYQWGWGVTLYYANWEDETYLYEALDVKPIPGHLNYVIPPGSRSCAGYATLDRVNGNLVSFVSYQARYRGGDNNADLDGLFNSQLCKPANMTTIANFAAAARKNGNMWLANSRVMFFVTAAIKRIMFHNRNIQASYNGTLTADGLRQGGISSGGGLSSRTLPVQRLRPLPFRAGESGNLGARPLSRARTGTRPLLLGAGWGTLPAFLGQHLQGDPIGSGKACPYNR